MMPEHISPWAMGMALAIDAEFHKMYAANPAATPSPEDILMSVIMNHPTIDMDRATESADLFNAICRLAHAPDQVGYMGILMAGGTVSTVERVSPLLELRLAYLPSAAIQHMGDEVSTLLAKEWPTINARLLGRPTIQDQEGG